mmetsp:Transcript_25999/g.52504  ORF Transcript_25999/g.52504 Transcript_25999/m.52504 type:complete len:221 (-) Transcript_25999:266-928(-)
MALLKLLWVVAKATSSRRLLHSDACPLQASSARPRPPTPLAAPDPSLTARSTLRRLEISSSDSCPSASPSSSSRSRAAADAASASFWAPSSISSSAPSSFPLPSPSKPPSHIRSIRCSSSRSTPPGGCSERRLPGGRPSSEELVLPAAWQLAPPRFLSRPVEANSPKSMPPEKSVSASKRYSATGSVVLCGHGLASPSSSLADVPLLALDSPLRNAASSA